MMRADRDRLDLVLEDIGVERIRQERIGEAKREDGVAWRSCANPEMAGGDPMRYLVLAEEVGEVARALLEDEGDDRLRDELVQVAAVAAAWAEAIDRRAERGINALRSALSAFYPTLAEQDAWLDAAHPLLGGAAPDDLLGTNREREVWALVDQLRSGAVV